MVCIVLIPSTNKQGDSQTHPVRFKVPDGTPWNVFVDGARKRMRNDDINCHFEFFVNDRVQILSTDDLCEGDEVLVVPTPINSVCSSQRQPSLLSQNHHKKNKSHQSKHLIQRIDNGLKFKNEQHQFTFGETQMREYLSLGYSATNRKDDIHHKQAWDSSSNLNVVRPSVMMRPWQNSPPMPRQISATELTTHPLVNHPKSPSSQLSTAEIRKESNVDIFSPPPILSPATSTRPKTASASHQLSCSISTSRPSTSFQTNNLASTLLNNTIKLSRPSSSSQVHQWSLPAGSPSPRPRPISTDQGPKHVNQLIEKSSKEELMFLSPIKKGASKGEENQIFIRKHTSKNTPPIASIIHGHPNPVVNRRKQHKNHPLQHHHQSHENEFTSLKSKDKHSQTSSQCFIDDSMKRNDQTDIPYFMTTNENIEHDPPFQYDDDYDDYDYEKYSLKHLSENLTPIPSSSSSSSAPFSSHHQSTQSHHRHQQRQQQYDKRLQQDDELKEGWKPVRSSGGLFNKSPLRGRFGTSPAYRKNVTQQLNKQVEKLAIDYIKTPVTSSSNDQMRASLGHDLMELSSSRVDALVL